MSLWVQVGRAARCARGWRPAREPSALRASLGVSARSSARPRRRPRAPRPGPVGQVARGFETAIAFAGEKWAVLVQFSGAKVSSVSVVPCWGRAVVLLVSSSLCFCVLCAIFVALLGLMCVRARNSSPCVLTVAKSWRLMARWASIFAEMRLKRLCRASLLCRVPGSRARLLAVLTLQCAAKPYWWHGGQPAQDTTYRASVRRKRHRPPPIGLACAGRGPGHHLTG